MPQEFDRQGIIENLSLLSEWLSVKYPGRIFQLTVTGGAAMALEGFKDQTQDIDVLRPGTLPSPLKDAIAHVSRAQRLPLEWMNTHAARVLRKAKCFDSQIW
jgi:hypothetical protein